MKSKDLTVPQDRLWTQSFICVCIANFLLFFAFYLLLPIMPLYLIEVFGTSRGAVGVILSSYTIAALIVRPFAGFVLDMFNRKPIYLIAYILFVSCFVGYTLASILAIFVIVRITHGLTFGMVTTASNSLVVDIMPASRRGEGLGYFGVANNLAMATGPMFSLFLHDFYNFNIIFYIAVGSGLLGFIIANTVKYNKKIERSNNQPISLDRFFLPKGLRGALSFLLMAVPYGMLTSYVAIYGKELGVASSMGIFFSLMAVGLIGSRLFAGKIVDRGKLLWVIACGTIISMSAFFILSSLGVLNQVADQWVVALLFYLVAVVLGVGYGMIFPAYNTLFVNLAPHNRRATASSTYLTSWDIGIGIGLIAGGRIGDTAGGLPMAYCVGACGVVLSIILFKLFTAPHYEKNKLR